MLTVPLPIPLLHCHGHRLQTKPSAGSTTASCGFTHAMPREKGIYKIHTKYTSYVNTYPCIHACAHTCPHVDTQACNHIHICTHPQIHTRAYTTCMYRHICTHVLCMFINCMCTHAHIQPLIYIKALRRPRGEQVLDPASSSHLHPVPTPVSRLTAFVWSVGASAHPNPTLNVCFTVQKQSGIRFGENASGGGKWRSTAIFICYSKTSMPLCQE